MARRRESLRREARKVAVSLGHNLDWFAYDLKLTPAWTRPTTSQREARMRRATAECLNCGMKVTVTVDNTYPISGEAVTKRCTHVPLAELPPATETGDDDYA